MKASAARARIGPAMRYAVVQIGSTRLRSVGADAHDGACAAQRAPPALGEGAQASNPSALAGCFERWQAKKARDSAQARDPN